MNLLDLLHYALQAVPSGRDEDGHRKGERDGDGHGEGSVVHLARCGHVNRNGYRDGCGLGEVLRLGGLVAGVGPAANAL